MSFVQDNLDRFDKIHSDYNNLANSVGNLINPSKDTKDNDVKNTLENLGSSTESAANLYLEGRKFINELKGKKLQKGLVDEVRKQGEKQVAQLLENHNSLKNQLLRSKGGRKARRAIQDRPTAQQDEAVTDSTPLNRNRAPTPKRDLPAKAFGKEAERFDNRRKQLQGQFDEQQNATQTDDAPAEPRPATQPAEPAPSAQPAEAAPSAAEPAPTPTRASIPERQPIPAEDDTDQTARSLQTPRSLGQEGGRTRAPADLADEGNGLESEASNVSRAASTAAEVSGGMEEAGGVLDAIPGLDLLGLALGAAGAVTSAVSSAIPDKKPDAPAPPPKQMQIGGDFSTDNVRAGGTTA